MTAPLKNQNAKKENPKTATFGGRCYEHEKASWIKAAGSNLNEWIVKTLNRATGRENHD